MSNAHELGFVVITDYVKANTGADVSDAIQKVIDDNPRRTIYFPDGEYVISKPICTGGSFMSAVSLDFSNFAMLTASDDWSSDEAMIRLGATDRAFRITRTGTNNYVSGGILNGNGIAKGLSIDSGREYSIRNISMKDVTCGIHVKFNAEYGSNDSDIFNVNIVGVGTKDSVGLLIDGFDNTFTNMRIANFQTGVKLTGAGNFLKNIHPLFIYKEDKDFNHRGELEYADSIGFDDQSGGNWYDICYPDNYATGFRMQTKTVSTYNNCYCYWYSAKGGFEVGFESTGQFNSIVTACKVDFKAETENSYLKVGEAGGNGVISNPMLNPNICTDKTYEEYLNGRVIYRTKW